MKNKGILFLTQAAMIAAIYVALTYVFAAISFGEVQLRIAEALTILPMFTPAAVPGLFIGCLIGNTIGAAALPDIVFGSLTTLAAAHITWKLRDRGPILGCLPPIVLNALVVPFILRYAYSTMLPIPWMMLTVGGGEVLGCGILGNVLYYALKKQPVIFKQQTAV